MMRRAALIPLVLLLTACVSYTLVEPKRMVLGPGFSVQPTLAWNQVSEHLVQGPAVIWTTEGQDLDTLLFFPGIEHGMPLLEKKSAADPSAGTAPAPVFRNTMSPDEIMELFEASMVRATKSTLAEASGLRPVTFAGQPGFRFEFSLTTKDQLERRGFAAGTINKDGKLYMIYFQGSRIYHFGKLREEAERIIASAQLI